MAFSGSVEGNSGTDTSPAPRCRRVLRVELRPEGREPRVPRVPRLTGTDPVLVATEPVRVEEAEVTEVAEVALVAARPQVSQ